MSFSELCSEKSIPSQLKFSSSADYQQTSMSNSDYGELVWENGQVVIKGGRFSKVSRFTHEDSFISSKTGKYRTNLGFDEAVTGDDDAHMAPWFYPLDDLFNHESTSGFLAEISGVTSNDLQSYTNFSATHKPSNPVKDSDLIALELQKRQDKQVLFRGGRTCDEANFSSFSRGKTDSDTHETAVAREGVLDVTDGQTNDSTREFLPVEKQATAMRGEDVLKLNQVIGGNVLIEFMDAEKIREPAAAAPSVCSDNGGVGASNNPTYHLKRKHNDEEDWEFSSEDAEEEPAAGYKRNRSAEVHNLTERKRREKINDKMRALQELIPNCNKVDKAMMLDEAIHYLRVLQFQVQIMSMCAPARMPQPGLQHLHALAHLPLFMPMGFATQGFPAQAAYFPGQSNPASTLWNEARPVLPGLSIPGSTVISMAAAEILNFKDLHIV